MLNDIRLLEQAVEAAYVKAEQHYNRSFKRATIRYDLKGRTAGQAITHYSTGLFELRFNIPIYVANKEHFLARTVPHEVAHLVARQLHPYHIQPHGREWQRVMLNLGVQPDRCHSYEVQLARVHQKFDAKCACKVHKIGKAVRARIVAGRTYRCTKCKQRVVLVNDTVSA
jgi:SprT protein